MKKLLLACLLARFAVEPSPARKAKEHDKDVIYDEARVPAYDLPPLLISSEGKPITTAEEWFTIRRPQIMSLFGNLVYGTVPALASPLRWTAAQDQRFALAISAESGCAGAALWRRKSGETLEKMVTRFPYWLCRNAWKFVNNEYDLPVDQHMLLACIAPRPVYVMSGVDDHWADPRGEYLSAYHASEVYRLLGKKGLESEASPPVGEPVIKSDVGYHIRPGGHSIEQFD